MEISNMRKVLFIFLFILLSSITGYSQFLTRQILPSQGIQQSDGSGSTSSTVNVTGQIVKVNVTNIGFISTSADYVLTVNNPSIKSSSIIIGLNMLSTSDPGGQATLTLSHSQPIDDQVIIYGFNNSGSPFSADFGVEFQIK